MARSHPSPPSPPSPLVLWPGPKQGSSKAWLHSAVTQTNMAANSDIRDPSARVRALYSFANQVEVDNDIPPKRYFRSGVEMERMVGFVRLLTLCFTAMCSSYFMTRV